MEQIAGGVELKRIYDYLLANQANVQNLSLLMDIDDGSPAVQVPFSMLQSVLNLGIFRPAQTLLSGGIIDLDCEGNQSAMFEPQNGAGDTPLVANFEVTFSNVGDTFLMSAVFQLTGTIIIQFPANTISSADPSSISTWASGSQQLTINAGVADVVEMQFLKYSIDGDWSLKVAEVAT